MKSILRAVALGLLVCVAIILVNNSVWPQVASVPKWSVHELALRSDERYTNPYTQIDVTATFQGPGDIKKTVRGFWDGDRTFKVRFTPTAEGRWTYSTTSSDAGLNGRTGIINCTAPRSGNHGFVRRDEKYPYHFVYDDDTRYFMFGQTYYNLMRLAMVKTNWKTSIDNSLATGMNKVRLFLAPTNSSKSKDPETSPYGSNKDTLNLSHWKKLDEVVEYMNDKGMVADLLLFNYETIYGTQVQDERYLRYAIARYAAFPNVIWCLVNEWNYTPKSQSYWNAMGRIVRDKDPWISEGAFLRPLSIHQRTRIDFQFFDASWPVHAIFQYGVRNKKYSDGDQWGNLGILYNLGHNMPVVNDEYGYIGEYNDKSVKGDPNLTREKHRQIIWGIYAAGGYGSAGDKYGYSTGRPYFSGHWYQPEEYRDIKRLVDFFTTKGIEYWKMSSQNSLLTSGNRVYVLARTGKQYVFYTAVGGTFSANIAPGTYTAHRYNPRTGEDIALADVVGGDSRSFAVPDSEDWVVYLNLK